MNYNIELKYSSEYLRGFNPVETRELLKQARQQLLELREQSSCGGRVMVAQKPHLFKKVKRDIARIKTILVEGG